MINISEAAENDIDAILKIEQESILPPWTHGALLNEFYRDDSYFIRAQNEDSISGFAILRLSADEAELLRIAVERSYRRKGIAGLLMDAVLHYAKEKELKAVHLEVRKSNAAAIHLYKKYGFKTVRCRKNYYSHPPEDAAVMIRNSLNT